MRDDGTTDWGTLLRRLVASALVLIAAATLYTAGAWLVVMNTDWCPSPWTRLDDGTCVSPM
jgi:hypothetical protein